MPITIIPAIALIILSTSNIVLALNNEITMLESQKEKNINIIKAKLSQLKKISVSIVFQYVGILLFLFSGILSAIFNDVDLIAKGILLLGVLATTLSIIILVVYSIKAVNIRQKHLEL